MTKSELREMIREILKEELTTDESSSWDWITRANWRAKNAPTSVYAVMTDDGPRYKNNFLTWDSRGNYYTTVDYLRGVGRWDIHPTVAEAEERARDADSGTFGGWQSPMHIIEITNFRAAYYGGSKPEYTIVKTI